ncbi:MAG: O-antigen ligase family protein [Bacteroidia bacterium]|nr:O-antigen ligase family protein [Bacteroidia bacterium]MBP9688345.1 O-antigen ligase family protein [Bacteroidia bacterium]
MTEQLKIKWFYTLGVIFVLLSAYGIYADDYTFHLLPLILIFAYLVLFKLDTVLLLLVFIVPLSIEFDDIGMGLGISLPDEPIVMIVMLLSIIRFIVDGSYDLKVFKHPISIWILINITWYIVTIFSSEMPLVSIKFVLSRVWFVVTYYFLGVMLFRKLSNVYKYLWLYAISLAVVVIYSLYMHRLSGFTQESSYYISMPFYRAHGIYSAAISFFIPLFFAYLFYSYKLKNNPIKIAFVATILALFLTGVFYSYTRAAWLSIVVALAMIFPLSFRIKLRTQLLILASGLILFISFQDQILYALSKNKQDSGEGFNKHLQSASNIKTDASNIERINRWMSAINMWKERPIMGFGPGTYVFCYAPYQEARYRTLISTNFGNQGNSHSEFLNPLSETGIIGMGSLIMIIFYGLNTAFNLFYQTKSTRLKVILIGVSLGLVSYYTHGFLNHYSETTEMAPLLWGSFAIIVAIDLYHKQQVDEITPNI